MKRPKLQRSSAFTLLELLLVIVVVAILAALLLPAVERARSRSRTTQCLSQLKQMGLALHAFAHEHDNKFPWVVSTNDGGTKGWLYQAQEFQVFSNDLVTPAMVLCPADKGRVLAESFATLRMENISYQWLYKLVPSFNCELVESTMPDEPIAADRNTMLLDERVLWLKTDAVLHGDRGNVLFVDGHVETVTGPGLNAVMKNPLARASVRLQEKPSGDMSSGTSASSGGGASSGASGYGGTGASRASAGAGGTSAAKNPGGAQSSGLAALESFFQPRGSSSRVGGDSSSPQAGSPAVASTPPSTQQSTQLFTVVSTNAPTRITNRVSVRETNTHVEIKNPASDIRTNVTVGRWLGDITPEEKSFLRWWLVLAILAVIVGIVAGTRRKKPSRPHGG